MKQTIENLVVSKVPEYWVLKNAYFKCNNPKHTDYSYYGARGIRMCRRWSGEEGFSNFISDMGFRPTNKHTLERIDNDGDYTPDNCRWATRREQALNRRVRRDNKAGVSGISKNGDKWLVRKVVAGKRYYVGTFKTLEQAKEAVV